MSDAALVEGLNAAIGGSLYSLRKAAKLNQTELGDALGLHRNTILRYEAGREMRVSDFLGICAVLGARPERLLDLHLQKREASARQLERERNGDLKTIQLERDPPLTRAEMAWVKQRKF